LTLTRWVAASRNSAWKPGWFKPASGVGRPQWSISTRIGMASIQGTNSDS